MLEFKKILTDEGYLDYHVHDACGDYLGRIINYEWTGEWLFQSPMDRSVVMTLEEMKDIVAMMNKLNGE